MDPLRFFSSDESIELGNRLIYFVTRDNSQSILKNHTLIVLYYF